MNDWQRIKINDLIACVVDNRGKTPPIDMSGEHELIEVNAISATIKFPQYDVIRKYIGANTYNTWFRSGHPKIGDILVPTVGTLGAVSYVREERGAIAQNLIALRTKSEICLGEFLYYVLREPSTKGRLLNLDIGGVQPSIKVPHLLGLEIIIPSMAEQKRIVEILSALDNKIENNIKTNQTLEQMAQSIYKSWFVDFEPFGGVMPSDWQVGKVHEFFNITIGRTPPRKEPHWFTNNPNDMAWISIADMGRGDTYIGNSTEYLTHNAIQKFNVPLAKENTVLLSFKLTIGRVSITDSLLTTNEAIAHFNNQKEITEYLYCYLKCFDFQTLGNTSSIGNAVNSQSIKMMLFIMPSEKILLEFHNITNPLFEQIRNNIKENLRLIAIRDTLLPNLMNGEIEIPKEGE